MSITVLILSSIYETDWSFFIKLILLSFDTKGLNFRKECLVFMKSSSFNIIELRYDSRASSDRPESDEFSKTGCRLL